MSLDIGNLVGHLGIETKGLDEGLEKGKSKLGAFAKSAGKLLAVGGAAAGALLVGGLVKAMDVQQANAKLAGQLGLTKGESARIGRAAGKLYSDNYGESLDDVNDALASVIQNVDGMRTASNGALQDISSKVIDVAKTFDQDYGGVTRAISNLMRTGLAPSAKAALDIITVGMQNGANGADDLLDTFNEYPTTIKALGLSAAQFTGLLSQGLKGGARDSDNVADALKEMSLQVGQNASGVAQALADIGVNGADATAAIAAGGPAAAQATQQILDGLRKAQAQGKNTKADISTIFGGPGEDLGAALFSLNLDTAASSLGTVTGAVDRLDKTVGNTAAGNIESFKRRATTTFVSFVGGKLLPIVTQVTGWFSSHLGPAIDGVTNFLHRHGEIVKQVAIVLGVAAGAIGVVIAVTKAWAAVQAVLNAVMTSNPIGIIVVAVAALVAGIVIAYNKVTWFHNLLNGVWAAIKTGWSVVAGVISSVWHGIIEPVWHQFADVVTYLYQTVLQPAFAWISAKWDELSGKISTLWTTRIQPALAAFGAAVQRLWQDYGQKLADWWNAHWPAMSATIQAAWTNFIQPALQAMGAIISWLWNTILVGIVDYVQTHWPQISATLQGAATAIGAAFSALGTIISTVWAVVSAVWNAMQAQWSAVSSVVSGAARAVSSAFSGIGSAASAAWNTLQTAWSTASTWFTNLKTTITTALSDAGSWLVEVGKNIVSGLVSGITGAAGWLKDQVVSIVKNAIPAPIRKILGINSPSRVMAEQVGQWIPKGIAVGINQHSGVVEDAMTNLVKIPAVSVPGARGSSGPNQAVAVAGSAGKVVHQENYITAGWSARETDAYLSMQAGVS